MSLKYIGKQNGLMGFPGIPARDLSDDEVEKFGGEAVLLELAGGRLYKRDKQAAKREDKSLKPEYEDKGDE